MLTTIHNQQPQTPNSAKQNHKPGLCVRANNTQTTTTSATPGQKHQNKSQTPLQLSSVNRSHQATTSLHVHAAQNAAAAHTFAWQHTAHTCLLSIRARCLHGDMQRTHITNDEICSHLQTINLSNPVNTSNDPAITSVKKEVHARADGTMMNGCDMRRSTSECSHQTLSLHYMRCSPTTAKPCRSHKRNVPTPIKTMT
jgi:hypothetical protein